MVEQHVKTIFDNGKTLLSASHDKMYVINESGITKMFNLKDMSEEPDSFETPTDFTAISAGSDFLLVATEEGYLQKYAFLEEEGIANSHQLLRSSLELTDCTIANDMIIAAGADLSLNFVRSDDSDSQDSKVEKIALPEEATHLSYTSKTSLLAVTLNKLANVQIYSLTSTVPRLVQTLDISTANGRVAWHPNGMQFAIPCGLEIRIYDINSFSLIKTLNVTQKIDFIAYSLDGMLLATVSSQNLNVWQVSDDGNDLKHLESAQIRSKIASLEWVMGDNRECQLLCTGLTGTLITMDGFTLKEDLFDKTTKEKSKNLFVDELAEESDDDLELNAENDEREELENKNEEQGYESDLNFIDDDENQNSNYKGEYEDFDQYPRKKRRTMVTTAGLVPFSQGSTPFGSNDRRYLTINNVGYISTVKNRSEQYSITVSFFDLSNNSEYHIQDLFGYDIAYLTPESVLFAKSKSGQIFFKPHDNLDDSWSKKIPLNTAENEIITCVAATKKNIYVSTSLGFFRIFNKFGLPISVERFSPIIAMTVYEYHIFLIHKTTSNDFLFSLFLQSPSKKLFFHKESIMPINNKEIKSIFFNTYGDPCIFPSDGILLVLSKWRQPLKASWVPIFDSSFELWKLSNGKDNSRNVDVWPLGVDFDTLNCILVKNTSSNLNRKIYPDFPLPLPTELKLNIPILLKSNYSTNDEDSDNDKGSDDEENENDGKLKISPHFIAQEELMNSKFFSNLLSDTLDNDGELYGNESTTLMKLKNEFNKSILRLFATACAEKNSREAWELIGEIKEDRPLQAAVKICERAGLDVLGKRIMEFREKNLLQEE